MRRLGLRVDSRRVRPWITGAAILAGLIWWISWLMDIQQIEGRAEDDEIEAAVATVTTQPVAIPSDGSAPLPIAELLPLGPEDVGFRVIVRGTVVGEPLDDGFWFLTDEDEVIFARQGQPAESGQDLTLTGTLQQIARADGERWAARANLREAAGWKVHRDLYLEVDIPMNQQPP